MATLTCGTVNFGDEVFQNDLPLMRGILATMHEHGVRPELEIFDAGHLSNAKRLAAEGLLTFPQHVDFVLGVPGALDATVRNLVFLVDSLPPGCTWSVAGIGRAQLPLATMAVAMGGHVRVGLEDNLYYAKGRLARNDELVARVARIAGELGRPVATPAQARHVLGLGERRSERRSLPSPRKRARRHVTVAHSHRRGGLANCSTTSFADACRPFRCSC